MALYQAFEAKAYAEMIQGVGYRSDAWIMVPERTEVVPSRILELLEWVFRHSSQVPLKPRGRWHPTPPPPRGWQTTLRQYTNKAVRSRLLPWLLLQPRLSRSAGAAYVLSLELPEGRSTQDQDVNRQHHKRVEHAGDGAVGLPSRVEAGCTKPRRVMRATTAQVDTPRSILSEPVGFRPFPL